MHNANSAAVASKPREEAPPLVVSLLKLLFIGLSSAIGLAVGLVVCAAIAIAYLCLAAIFVTLVSVAFTPACGFVALLLAIWFPISLFTAA